MNEDQLNDLKQFIAATVSQATAGMATKDDIVNMATKDDIVTLGTKIDDVELKIDTISDALNEQLNDHNARLTKLERQTA